MTPDPRVYWLTDEFYPPQIGGVELMASYLSQGLAARGLATRVITRQTRPPSPRHEQLGPVWVTRIRPAGQIKGSGWLALPLVLAYLGRLAFILLRDARRYDVIIVSGMKIIPLVAVPIAKLLRKRCVIRVESTFEVLEPISAESATALSPLGARLLRASLAGLQRRMLLAADRIVAISSELENLLLRLDVSPARIARIPNAVDLDKFRPVSGEQRLALRCRLGISPAATVALFVGRLSRAKGILLLIDAWPELIEGWPALQLIIVGSGKGSFDDCEAEVAESIRARRLGERVRMVGPSNVVEQYLQAADLCVYPSEYEGFGIGIIEALGCGVPLAVTPVGVARDLIRHGENGFLFPINDRAALIATLDAMLTQRERWPQISASARTAVLPYALASIVEQFERLCRASLPSEGPARLLD